MMVSPNPVSLLCAILLCLPLAIVFTITGDNYTYLHVSLPSSFISNLDNTRALEYKTIYESLPTGLTQNEYPNPEKYPKEISKNPDSISRDKKNPEKIDNSPQKMNRKPELIPKSPERIDKTPEKIDKNPQKMNQKPELIPKNPEKIDKSPQKMNQKPELIPKNPEKIEKNPQNIDKTPQKINQNAEPISKNPPKIGTKPANTTTEEPGPTPPPPPPPPPPLDTLTEAEDAELLKRASRVNPDPLPNGASRKIAFLFMTTTPLPFAPIWEHFFNQTDKSNRYYNIYIHADPGSKYNPPFSGVFSGRVIPSSKPTHRNTPTLISAARRLLAHALLDDPANYMFQLLSAACIPLHSFNFTYALLAGAEKSFIEILKNETTAYGRWAARGEDAMLPEVRLEQFRIGSQFWGLTRQHARLVVSDVRLWRKFRLPCHTPSTCYPEENYFPTLLSMVDPQGVVPATLTHVDWSVTRGGHPRAYNGSDVVPELIQRLRKARPRYGDYGMNGSDLDTWQRWDPFLFARKFKPNCLEPLMKISKEVLFKD